MPLRMVSISTMEIFHASLLDKEADKATGRNEWEDKRITAESNRGVYDEDNDKNAVNIHWCYTTFH